MEHVVGIGECVISNNKIDTIKTYALSSCIAVTVYDKSKQLGGMIHVALPKPMDEDGEYRPGYYATTGIPYLINRLYSEHGCKKSDLIIRLYGGADSIYENDMFYIGKRNLIAVTDTLAELNLMARKAEIGGRYSRTIEMELETGSIKVTRQPIKI